MGFIYDNKIEKIIWKLIEPFIADHVRNITGIIANDKPIDPIQLAQEAALSNICVIIAGELFAISTINEEQEKNSGKQSDSLPSEELLPAKSTD